ncbi:PucR family transcriptional regulator [Micromonospora mirobrigensis]|uniref:PucR C-terminal helix-turn-helix domain-containing protein n=1 Tax=Micromonospora mirobrigensis TaxID=262898 RepID=A0A1C4V236_9ACTN|nr:helix-turn-helix domain-containing protein [Micromonospora mirobrigensis]SCE77936.1 PucR C-terminal helix-turn-helix domain-containing protein [Micromonospora mirobrigensis]
MRRSHSSLLRHVGPVASAVDRVLARDLPALLGPPQPSRDASRRLLRALLRRALRRAAAGAPWTAADLDLIARQGARAATYGAGAGALELGVRVCVNVGLQTLWSVIDENGTEELLRLSSWLHQHLPATLAAVSRGYCAELRQQFGSVRIRRLVAEGLLTGADVGTLAATAGFALPAAFLVLAVRGGPADGPLPDGVLHVGTADEQVFLFGVPATGNPGARRRTVEAAAQELVAALARDAAEVTAGRAFAATRAEVPRARAEAGRVARLAVATGAYARVHASTDVLLESTVVGAGAAAERLAGVLDGLDGRPDLIETLETFFANDFDRTRSAQALFLHRRTLQLRLHRISELTGHSPTTARGSLVLNAALCARRLRRGIG